MTSMANKTLIILAGRYLPCGSLVPKTAPESRSQTSQALAVMSGTTNPAAFFTPQVPNSLGTWGSGVGVAAPGTGRSEVVTALGGCSALGQLFVSGALVLGAGVISASGMPGVLIGLGLALPAGAGAEFPPAAGAPGVSVLPAAFAVFAAFATSAAAAGGAAGGAPGTPGESGTCAASGVTGAWAWPLIGMDMQHKTVSIMVAAESFFCFII